MSEIKWGKALLHALITTVMFFIILAVISAVFVLTNYNHLGRLVEVIGIVRSDYLEEVPMEKIVDGAIQGIAGNLDEYSGFQDVQANQDLQYMIEGEFGGIGIYVGEEKDKLMVGRPIQSSPAEKAGLETGDQIVMIDGAVVADMSQEEAIAKLKGEVGTQVTVEVYRESNKETFERVLTRETISVPSVEWKPYPGDPEIAVIDISTFNMKTGQEFDAALSEIDKEQTYKGILIDLRNNLGGEMGAAVYMASRLSPQGPVVHTVNRDGRLKSQQATADFINRPFVLMINGYSASASEIVTGAVKDYGSGPIVGVKTFGKGVVQKVYNLDSETGLKLTTEKYLTPLMNDIHKKGILPDHEVVLNKDEKTTILPEADPDRQMQKAHEVLKEEL